MENKVQNNPPIESQTDYQGVTQAPAQTPEAPKQKSRLVIGLTALVLLLSGTTGYLAYQNYQLKKAQIGTIQLTPTPISAFPSPAASTPQPITPTEIPATVSTDTPAPNKINTLLIPYNPKKDWQTYTDDVAKFSIQYNNTPTQPYNSHQSLDDHQAGVNVRIMICNTPPNSQEVCLEQYTMMVYSNYGGGSRREWMNNNINDYPNCQRYYKDISIVGKNALLATSNCSSWGETYILIPNEPQMIVLLAKGYSRNDTTGEMVLQTWIKEALSTFKFL